ALIPRHYLRKHAGAYCPECIKAQGYLPFIFDFSLIDTCPYHGIKLLTSCSSCQQNILWHRKSISDCQCGEPLPLHSSKSDPKIVKFLLALIEGSQQEEIDFFIASFEALSKLNESLCQKLTSSRLQELAYLAITQQNLFIHALHQLNISEKLHPRTLVSSFIYSLTPEVNALALDFLSSVEVNHNHFYNKHISDTEIGLKQTALVLGISQHLVKDLINSGNLNAYQARKTSGWSISLLSINQLLIQLTAAGLSTYQSKTYHLLQHLNHPRVYVTFAEVITNLLNGKIQSRGFSLEEGLNSLLIGDLPAHYLEKELDIDLNDFADLNSMAEILGCPYSVAQSIASLNLVEVIKLPGNTSKRLISRDSIKKFNEIYVISSVLAKRLGMSTVSLPKHLTYCGATPAFTPKDRGCVCYIFKKEDIVTIPKEKLVKTLPAGSWSKLKNLSQQHYDAVPIPDAAMDLGVRFQVINALLNRKILIKSKHSNSITRESLDELLSHVHRPDFLAASAVLEHFEITYSLLYSIFIQTDLIKLKNLYIIGLIPRDSICLIRKYLSKYATAKQSAELLGLEKYQFRNLVKGGQYKVRKKLKGRQYPIDLFDKNEILNTTTT
ncbi:MAG: hypothetical protein KC478_17005, partial [Bacteriovoracaceae bacterium]|nr:hypothetical protein [Bacteriovoracaceae bacterium]